MTDTRKKLYDNKLTEIMIWSESYSVDNDIKIDDVDTLKAESNGKTIDILESGPVIWL